MRRSLKAAMTNNSSTISSKTSKEARKNHPKINLQTDTRHTKPKWAKTGKNSGKWTEILKHARVSDTVDSLCRYQCPKCEVTYATRGSLCRHFKKTKHVTLSEICVNDYLIKITAYQCQICSQTVLCDKEVIRLHLLHKHSKMSLKEYCEQTNVKCTKKKRICKGHMEEFTALVSNNYDSSDSVGNLCRFSCTKCGFTCNSWPALTKHLTKNKHGPLLSVEKYLTKTTFHTCYICKEVVLCDARLFWLHLSEHKITLKQYKK